MANPTVLVLYTRNACHLCEQAARMLEMAGIEWRDVDIDADPELAAIYGLRVPVVSAPGSGRELDFPFTEDELRWFAADASQEDLSRDPGQ